MKYQYLTKSLAMIGVQCPRKLYYHTHPEIYQNDALEDPFLVALAEGGFQVGALAKVYHPTGIDLADLRPEAAITRTQELLQKEQVTIFEATFRYKNLLVRVDVLRKDGVTVDLLEVKAKSYDPNTDRFFNIKGKQLIKSWEPYLYDLAYQTYVCSKVCPNLTFKPFLYLTDKTAKATVDGLNQRFMLMRQGNKTIVKIAPTTDCNTLGAKVLVEVDASLAINWIFESGMPEDSNAHWWDQLPFELKILELAKGLQYNQKLQSRLDAKCKHCEFRCIPIASMQSGFKECWSSKVPNAELDEPFVFDVWYWGKEANKVLNSDRFLMQDLTQDDFTNTKSKKVGLTRSQRQWLQVAYLTQSDRKYFDRINFAKELATWRYPLHFIDFETSRVALPFNKGRSPYEQIAFQFSHHMVYEDHTIAHVGEYLNDGPGVFPNFDFIRQLKAQLEEDQGTIFRYSNHENTVLCDILQQLQNSTEPDREELIVWIKGITKKDEEWLGERNMVDLYDLVINYFYHPRMAGSNSLKVVLPTILSDSNHLQHKYKQPIYGAEPGIKSLNFQNFALIQYDQNGQVKDPYKLLPKLFADLELQELEVLFKEEEINHGGAAMTAYAKMQFTEMSAIERQQLRRGLLKYCELDTFAMVLLYEYFLEQLK